MPRNQNLSSRILCSLIALSIASASIAAEKPKTKKKRIVPKAPDGETTETDTTPAQGASQTARGANKVGIDALYTPVSDFALSYGGSVNYNLSPSLNVGLVALMGNSTVSKSETDNGIDYTANAKIAGSAYYVYGRYFFGNSFNAAAGLGLRTATVTYNEQIGGSAIALNGKIDIQSIVLPIFIGNRWSFGSGFTIGCDWIGDMIAISGSAKSTLDGNLDNDTIKSFNQEFLDLGNSLAHKSSVTLLLTSIGWAF